ncbi:MAG: glutamate racemase [Erysipelotrichaceae bacterium]|nr:glutamate racemase [Erysipelotrichaceae bacterium]
MKKQYIGVFDSGLGGLTTVSQIIEKLPEENIVFLADTKHIPYGSKSREQIISYTRDNIRLLQSYGLKAVVIACNTSDANASDAVRKEFDLPIFGVLRPASIKAYETSANKKIGLIATASTIASRRYEEELLAIDPEISLYPAACPDLVPMIENGSFLTEKEAMEEKLREYIDPLVKEGIDTLILGCTHYDILSDLILGIYPQLKLVSSSRCVVFDLEAWLKEHGAEETGTKAERIYLASKDAEDYDRIASCLIPGIKFKDTES